jgi:predicted O-methyltransferase YrrM
MGKVFQRLIDLGLFYWKAKNYKLIYDEKISSFVYRVLEIEPDDLMICKIENVRTKLRNSNSRIEFIEMGAGQGLSGFRNVRAIAEKSLSPKWKCKVLFNLAKEFRKGAILELGTSLGISTSYLAAANNGNIIYTIDGNDSVSDLAKKSFAEIGIENIRSYTGNFDDVLQQILPEIEKIDLVFIDGNHNQEATLRYFDTIMTKSPSIVVIDDIYWSKRMKQAWKAICDKEEVCCSLDFFQFGIVFFDSLLTGKHSVIKQKLKCF